MCGKSFVQIEISSRKDSIFKTLSVIKTVTPAVSSHVLLPYVTGLDDLHGGGDCECVHPAVCP